MIYNNPAKIKSRNYIRKINIKSFVILVMQNFGDIFFNTSKEKTWVRGPNKIPNGIIMDKIKEDLDILFEINNQNLILNDFINLDFQYILNSGCLFQIIYLDLL